MSESKNVDTRNATQKIEDLERVVAALYQGLMEIGNKVESLLPLRNDMGLVRESLRLLNIRSEAIIQSASLESGITLDSVNSLVLKMNVESLSVLVANHVENGRLTPATEVTKDSFLVGEEYNKDGTVNNPRVQFRLDSQGADTAAVLLGKKAGDMVSFGEDKFDFKITEVYALTTPQAVAPVAEASNAEAAAEPVAAEPVAAEPVAAEPTAVEAAASEAAPLPALPAESPVTEFVPHDNSKMATA